MFGLQLSTNKRNVYTDDGLHKSVRNVWRKVPQNWSSIARNNNSRKFCVLGERPSTHIHVNVLQKLSDNDVSVLLLVKRAADRAARMAGTVYRVLAGTDDVGLPAYPPVGTTTASIKHTRAVILHSVQTICILRLSLQLSRRLTTWPNRHNDSK